MASIVYLNSPDGIHNTYGISIIADSQQVAQDFKWHVIDVCEALNCHYFIQGQDFCPSGNNWVYIEFLGEINIDRILKVISEYERIYKKEVLMDVPSRELLISLKLL